MPSKQTWICPCEWPHILSTVDTYDTIRHMDYSENLSQLYKHKAQSCYFSTKQFTLHCTVENRANEERNHVYHLSNDTKPGLKITVGHRTTSDQNPKLYDQMKNTPDILSDRKNSR